MADDFSNLRKLKKPLFQPAENIIAIKQTTCPKSIGKIRFVITRNKNNSWVDDLHEQEQLNMLERIYH